MEGMASTVAMPPPSHKCSLIVGCRPPSRGGRRTPDVLMVSLHWRGVTDEHPRFAMLRGIPSSDGTPPERRRASRLVRRRPVGLAHPGDESALSPEDPPTVGTGRVEHLRPSGAGSCLLGDSSRQLSRDAEGPADRPDGHALLQPGGGNGQAQLMTVAFNSARRSVIFVRRSAESDSVRAASIDAPSSSALIPCSKRLRL